MVSSLTREIPTQDTKTNAWPLSTVQLFHFADENFWQKVHLTCFRSSCDNTPESVSPTNWKIFSKRPRQRRSQGLSISLSLERSETREEERPWKQARDMINSPVYTHMSNEQSTKVRRFFMGSLVELQFVLLWVLSRDDFWDIWTELPKPSSGRSLLVKNSGHLRSVIVVLWCERGFSQNVPQAVFVLDNIACWASVQWPLDAAKTLFNFVLAKGEAKSKFQESITGSRSEKCRMKDADMTTNVTESQSGSRIFWVSFGCHIFSESFIVNNWFIHAILS